VLDFLFEIVLQLVFELLLEGLMRLLGRGLTGAVGTTTRGCAAMLGATAGRILLLACAGFGFGVYWGNHLSGLRGHRPRLLWVSIALAGVFALVASWRWSREREVLHARATRPTDPLPWRWPATRLAGAAVLNASIAIGIAAGFTPGVPG
jgi:hypothetical protein